MFRWGISSSTRWRTGRCVRDVGLRFIMGAGHGLVLLHDQAREDGVGIISPDA